MTIRHAARENHRWAAIGNRGASHRPPKIARLSVRGEECVARQHTAQQWWEGMVAAAPGALTESSRSMTPLRAIDQSPGLGLVGCYSPSEPTMESAPF